MLDNKKVNVYILSYDSLNERFVFQSNCYEYSDFDEYNNIVIVDNVGVFKLDVISKNSDYRAVFATTANVDAEKIRQELSSYIGKDLSMRIKWMRAILDKLDYKESDTSE